MAAKEHELEFLEIVLGLELQNGRDGFEIVEGSHSVISDVSCHLQAPDAPNRRARSPDWQAPA